MGPSRREAGTSLLLLLLHLIATSVTAFQGVLPSTSILSYYASSNSNNNLLSTITNDGVYRGQHRSSSSPIVVLNNQRNGQNYKATTSNNNYSKNTQNRRRQQGNNGKAAQINQTLRQHGQASKWNDLLELYKKEKTSFTHINYAILMNQLGRSRGGVAANHPVLDELLDGMVQIIETNGIKWFGSRSASNIAHAIGKLRLRSNKAEKLMLAIAKNAPVWLAKTGNPQDIANIVWAFATLGLHQAPLLFEQVDQNAKRFMVTAKPQEVSNTIWAFATLDNLSPPTNLCSAIEERAEWFITNAKPQEVANTVWAFATLDGVPAPTRLLSATEQCAHWLVQQGYPQAVSNTVWAFATLGVPAPRLLDAVERRAEWLVLNGTPQAVANTVWSFATLSLPAPRLCREIEHQAEWLVTNGNPQEVANTAWAMATLGVSAAPSSLLLAQVEEHATWLVDRGSPQAVANTCWAFATLHTAAPILMEEVELKAEWLVQHANTQELANTLWAMALLGVEGDDAMSLLDAVDPMKIITDDTTTTTCTSQNLANLLWAFSMMMSTPSHDKKLAMFWQRAMEIDHTLFSNDEIGQLAKVDLFSSSKQQQLTPRPSVELQRRMETVCGALVNTQSKFQNDISKTLFEIGFHHEQEVSPNTRQMSSIINTGGLLAIDIANTDRMVAIECDGPHHFLNTKNDYDDHENHSVVENGNTKRKRRFLQEQGWTVINLHYKDWDEVVKQGREKEWLESKLAEVVVMEDASDDTLPTDEETVLGDDGQQLTTRDPRPMTQAITQIGDDSNDEVAVANVSILRTTVADIKAEIRRRNDIRKQQGLGRILLSGNKQALIDRLLADDGTISINDSSMGDDMTPTGISSDSSAATVVENSTGVAAWSTRTIKDLKIEIRRRNAEKVLAGSPRLLLSGNKGILVQRLVDDES